MPFSLPYGYQANLISQVSCIEDLSTFTALEESQPEGSRLLCSLTFAQRPSADLVTLFNHKCREQGVSPWPEYQDIVFLDAEEPTLYVCWWKGFAWWAWILILLASLVLPPLIMAGLWLILPESIKQMMEMVTYLMVMGLVMFAMSKMMKGARAEAK